jgi:hypothetical protein
MTAIGKVSGGRSQILTWKLHGSSASINKAGDRAEAGNIKDEDWIGTDVLLLRAR